MATRRTMDHARSAHLLTWDGGWTALPAERAPAGLRGAGGRGCFPLAGRADVPLAPPGPPAKANCHRGVLQATPPSRPPSDPPVPPLLRAAPGGRQGRRGARWRGSSCGWLYRTLLVPKRLHHCSVPAHRCFSSPSSTASRPLQRATDWRSAGLACAGRRRQLALSPLAATTGHRRQHLDSLSSPSTRSSFMPWPSPLPLSRCAM
jgi:hypothetical protein